MIGCRDDVYRFLRKAANVGRAADAPRNGVSRRNAGQRRHDVPDEVPAFSEKVHTPL
jgi:hypothetical protein